MPWQKPQHLLTAEVNFECCNVSLFKQNKLNKDHQEINMRAFNWNLKNLLSLNTSHSKETNENFKRKQSFLENINVYTEFVYR